MKSYPKQAYRVALFDASVSIVSSRYRQSGDTVVFADFFSPAIFMEQFPVQKAYYVMVDYDI
jgi:hypothetical protein